GTGTAIDYQIGFFGSVMMGVLTATAGGMIRDILSNRVPLVLQREVYASACLAGGALLYLLHLTAIPRDWGLVVSAVAVTGVRLLAIRHGWALPRATVKGTKVQ
ncbi:MAG: TRIC cation channel family protein, partial [Desulfuromonadaceae bacterium]